jgi:Alginate export
MNGTSSDGPYAILRGVWLAIAWSGAVAAQAGIDANAPPADVFDQATAHPIREYASPRILQGASRAQERNPLPATDVDAGVLQTGDLAKWPRLYRDEKLLVTGSFTGTLGLFEMRNNIFDVPAASASPGYRVDPGWGELFVEPGIGAQWTLDPAVQVYGGVTYMETATRGIDYSGIGNTTHGDRELLYGGVKLGPVDGNNKIDLSYGQQDYKVGTSFLIASGASNGAQRGASYLGPRVAWANAALAKANLGGLSIEGFWLKPNDAPAAATGTRLSGLNIEGPGTGPLRVGAMYVYADESDIETRKGLNVYDLRARWHPVADAPQFWVQGEAVWQRKSGVDANGWYVEATYNASTTRWKPLVTLRYSSFSGDKPGTATWEGFDPLYFGGSTPDWYQGKIGSTLFGNTNLQAIAATVTLAPSDKQLWQFILLNFAARQINAPLAVPAPNESPPIGGGVPTRALATEFDAVYTYTFSKAVNVNVFAGYAAPGAGYKQLYASEGGAARDSWVLGTQFNFSY